MADVNRMPNWSENEKVHAVQLINEAYEVLFSRYKGSQCGGKAKEAAWVKIVDSLNASGVTQCRRTVDQTKSMYKNLKSRAKQKDNDRVRTGGGPAIKMMPAEEEVLLALKDKPQLNGVVGGVESGDSSMVEMEEANNETVITEEMNGSTVETDIQQTASVIDNDIQPNVSQTSKLHTSIGKSKKKYSNEKKTNPREELLDLEIKRASLEVKKLQQQIDHGKEEHELKMQHYINSIAQQKAIFDLKCKYIEANVNVHDLEFNFES